MTPMQTFPRLERGLVLALTTEPTLATTVGDQVYRIPAPAESTPPYILFAHQSGGVVNKSPRPSLDVYYRIEYVAADMDAAEAGFEVVYQHLITAPLIIDGWNNYATTGAGKFLGVYMNFADPRYSVAMHFRIRADLVELSPQP